MLKNTKTNPTNNITLCCHAHFWAEGFACVHACMQLQQHESVLRRELSPASGARNLTLRHPLPIPLLMSTDLPA